MLQTYSMRKWNFNPLPRKEGDGHRRSTGIAGKGFQSTPS